MAGQSARSLPQLKHTVEQIAHRAIRIRIKITDEQVGGFFLVTKHTVTWPWLCRQIGHLIYEAQICCTLYMLINTRGMKFINRQGRGQWCTKVRQWCSNHGLKLRPHPFIPR